MPTTRYLQYFQCNTDKIIIIKVIKVSKISAHHSISTRILQYFQCSRYLTKSSTISAHHSRSARILQYYQSNENIIKSSSISAHYSISTRILQYCRCNKDIIKYSTISTHHSIKGILRIRPVYQRKLNLGAPSSSIPRNIKHVGICGSFKNKVKMLQTSICHLDKGTTNANRWVIDGQPPNETKPKQMTGEKMNLLDINALILIVSSVSHQ